MTKNQTELLRDVIAYGGAGLIIVGVSVACLFHFGISAKTLVAFGAPAALAAFISIRQIYSRWLSNQ